MLILSCAHLCLICYVVPLLTQCCFLLNITACTTACTAASMGGHTFEREAPFATTSFKKGAGLIFEGMGLFSRVKVNVEINSHFCPYLSYWESSYTIPTAEAVHVAGWAYVAICSLIPRPLVLQLWRKIGTKIWRMRLSHMPCNLELAIFSL